MRVLWICHNVPYPPVRGVLQRNYNLVRQIGRRAELHLLALRQHALCPDQRALERAVAALSPYCTSIRVLALDWERSRARRAALLASLALPGRPYDAARYASAQLHRELARLSSIAPDAVHVDTVGLAGRRLQMPAPAVLNHHNVESHMLARRAENAARALPRAVYRWQARAMRSFERRSASRFACNLVVSELDRQRLLEIAPTSRVRVIPNGVDVEYFDAPAHADPESRTVVFVGGQSWYPNRDAARYFLECIWPAVTRREPRARWLVVGRDPCSRVLEAARRDRRIQATGFLEDLRPSVASAAVFVCPFREGGGTRLKLLDALAMRKAIVSTSVGVEGVAVRDRKHVLVADAAETFAERIVELFERPKLRVELGEAGRALVEERYGWGRIGAELLRVYREVAAARRR